MYEEQVVLTFRTKVSKYTKNKNTPYNFALSFLLTAGHDTDI